MCVTRELDAVHHCTVCLCACYDDKGLANPRKNVAGDVRV